MSEPTILGSIRLRGDLDGEPVSLVLDAMGLWLMAGEDAIDGLDVLAEPIRYFVGTLRDEIELRGRRFGIPPGRGGDTRRLLALGRLRGTTPVRVQGPFLDTITELELAWLSGFLEEQESLLAFLHTTTKQEVPSDVGSAAEVEARFVWTDRRAALVAIGPWGDVAITPLEGPLEVNAERGRDRARCGEVGWRTTLFNESRHHAVAVFFAESAWKRMRFVLRAALDEGDLETATLLVRRIEGPIAEIERALIDDASIDELGAFVSALGADAIVEWASDWRWSRAKRERLRDALYAFDPASPHAIALHGALRAEGLAGASELDQRVLLDVVWVERLRDAGHLDDARAAIDARLGTLAAPEAADLVPHGTEDAERDPQLRARVALLETLVTLDEPSALHDLARLEPLREERIRPLVERAADPRASRVLRLLEQGVPANPPPPPGTREPFDDEDLRLLRHPVGRSEAFLAGLQSLIAKVDVPDHSALRAYCPRLSDELATAAFERAAVRLGVDATAYVSQGDRAVGCRAHDDGEASFVILGGSHLDPESARHLGPAGLAFVLGAELAHLRFGHARVTASELWTGAFDVGVSGFDLLLGAIPVLGRWKLGDGISHLANAVKDGTIGKAFRIAGRALGVAEKEDDDEVHLAAGELLAAHRLMQLTADRVGLVMAGDPGAAIHAMLALEPGDVLTKARESNLHDALAERDPKGRMLYPELAVRASALLSFWLGEEWMALR